MKNISTKIKYIPFQVLLSFALLFSVSAHVFASEITEQNLLKGINQERTSRGLQSLKINRDLDNAARLKAKDMINRDYFEHYAFGLSPWDFMSLSGYEYIYAGENLAMDFATSEGMIKAWMNSPAHRDNILSPEFKEIGVGTVKGAYTDKDKTHDTIMVSTMFGTPKPKIIKVIDYIINIFVPFR